MKLTIALLLFYYLGFHAAGDKSTLPFYSGAGDNSSVIQTDTTIDVTYYKLQLKLSINPDNIKGITTVNGKFITPGNSFFLNLANSLTVDSVTGANIGSFTHSNDVLRVNLNSLSSEFAVNVYYRGLPPATGYGSFVFSSHGPEPSIWSLSEPYGSSDWFPNKNAPADKADSSDVWVTCPSSLTAVSNGLLKETITNPDNTTTYRWKGSYPIASYLISIAVSNYALYKNYFRYSQTDSLTLTHYVYPEYLGSLKSNLDETPEMMRVFSEKYSQYPFIREKYGHAQFGWGGGMEHQTISSMGAFTPGVIAHELSHQWYGDKVTCRDFHHIWLNEGFATYSEAVYIEASQGREAYDYFMLQKMNSAKNAVGTVYVQNAGSISEIFNTNRSYYKGGVILHMLRGVTGDSLFYDIMKSYVNDTLHAYGTAVTEDFQRIAESKYGKSLGYFFYEWIYGEKYPKYRITWGKSQVGGNSYDVNLLVEQAVNTNPVFFTMPVDVKVETKSGDTTVTVFNNSQTQTFVFTITGEPLRLTFDPGNFILKDKTGDDPVEPIDFRLDQNYPNPFNPATVIAYHVNKYDDVSLTVYDVRGREIAVLVNAKMRPGNFQVKFTPVNLASGIYFCVLKSGSDIDSKKMIYIR